MMMSEIKKKIAPKDTNMPPIKLLFKINTVALQHEKAIISVYINSATRINVSKCVQMCV